jgi:hypothetical protein
MKIETDQTFHVRVSPSPTRFGKLLNGRLFHRPGWRDPTEVWIKFNKNSAQSLTNDHLRLALLSEEVVIEVILSEMEVAHA